MQWFQEKVSAARRHARGAGRSVRRAWKEPGRERDVAFQAAKAALAAGVAWAVVGWWLQAPMAFMAPWVAIVLVESTVYRSIAHGLQQLAAIATGTVVATACAMVLDSTLVAMALVLPVAVLLGNWRRLGSQGIYAATAALFVLTSGPVGVGAAGARIAEAVFGAVVGIAVNALIRPPLYLRDTRAALDNAAREAQDLLGDVADGLARGRPDADEATGWHDRALRLDRLVGEARSAVGWTRESLRANPRRRRPGVAVPEQHYDDVLTVLDDVAVHAAGVTRTILEVCARDDDPRWPGREITGPYADFLHRTAHALHWCTSARVTPGEDPDPPLREATEVLRDTLDDLRRRLPDAVPDDPDGLATYGTLLNQARRLADRLEHSGRR
ncbi:aromatic acid exporter family protein [Streptomyces sp. NPDC057798]|uniref:FUSC family protein n=1 Tax=Streptomyces sp. NPDC057798 TaxID=3346252 RepID=UPI00368A1317